MRVSILTHMAHCGAFGTVTRNIAKGLAALDVGVGVDVLYLRGPDPAVIWGYPSGTRLLRLGGRSRTCWLALARHLRERRPDALISLGWILNPAAVVAVAVARTRTPLFLNEASLLSYKTRVEHRDDRRLRHVEVVARLLYPRATAVTGVSAAVVADLVEEIGLDPQRVPLHVMPNAVDAREVVARSLVGGEIVSGPEPVFVNVARHARQKNLPLLLRAFRLYLKDGRSGTLVLIGAGPETQSLCKLAGDLDIAGSVRFLGAMANPFPQVAAATAFVLSSEEEGFGLVLVEAMALGVPVIATDCPGAPRDILLDGRAGLLVPLNDERALADAMHRIATEPTLRAQLSSSGRERATDFSPSTIGRAWLTLIEGTASSAANNVGMRGRRR